MTNGTQYFFLDWKIDLHFYFVIHTFISRCHHSTNSTLFNNTLSDIISYSLHNSYSIKSFVFSPIYISYRLYLYVVYLYDFLYEIYLTNST